MEVGQQASQGAHSVHASHGLAHAVPLAVAKGQEALDVCCVRPPDLSERCQGFRSLACSCKLMKIAFLEVQTFSKRKPTCVEIKQCILD